MKRLVPLIPLVAAALISGCASTGTAEMDSLRGMAQEAMERADAASAAAGQASSQAAQASRDAAAAMEAARDAQACCQANTQRINRAFKDAMSK
ncbi:Lpp/OprI family alanine-zipper lipoprotein [Marinobacterium jannaschii]|uniref:Lpp/OprI family alanine-zipper lipoprotein n=1 Tax=Marinobacterium jannaschii TaxID=64970 RepID=UPI00055EA850|nr:Lpp/OprI family alanine-zipper lipoprotein [Marinobacterium jannaschii]